MNVNFILPDDRDAGRARPSIFAASCLFLLAAAGLLLTSWLMYPIYWIIGRIAPGIGEDVLKNLTQLAYYALFVVLPLCLYVKKTPGMLDAMRISPITLIDALIITFAAISGVMLSVYIGSLWTLIIEALGGVIPESGVSVPGSTGELLLSILLVGVIPGVCEELLFRGTLLSAWEERGTHTAIIVSTMLFAAMHGSVAGIPTQLMVGAALAYSVVKTGSLFAGMIYHTVHNATLMILAFRVSAIEIPEETASLSSFEQIGGASGLFSIFINILIFGALFIFLLRRLSARRARRGERDNWLEAPETKRELGWPELTVIAAGLITVGMMYLLDILEIAGMFA